MSQICSQSGLLLKCIPWSTIDHQVTSRHSSIDQDIMIKQYYLLARLRLALLDPVEADTLALFKLGTLEIPA